MIRQEIMKTRKADFVKNTLPEMFRQMKLLGITMDDIIKYWNE